MDAKPNDNEIVKALRICVECAEDGCPGCPYAPNGCDRMHAEAADLIESMQAQLAESQRRERAAVEDMKLIVDAVREEHCDETCCFACKFDCDTSITDSGDHACECPGFERDDCFEWRGPQAGEGERDGA